MADEKTPQHPDIQLKLIHMNDVQETKTRWLWYPYIPYGKITIIQGDPGEGKKHPKCSTWQNALQPGPIFRIWWKERMRRSMRRRFRTGTFMRG